MYTKKGLSISPQESWTKVLIKFRQQQQSAFREVMQVSRERAQNQDIFRDMGTIQV